MNQRVIIRSVLDSISQKIFNKPFSILEKGELEEMGWMVTYKVTPILEDSVLMRVLKITPDELKTLRRRLASGESSTVSLLQYEKAKSWKANKLPNEDSRLILAKYLGYSTWAECAANTSIPQEQKTSRPRISIDWRMLVLVVLAASAIFIALNLNRLTNLFENMSGGRVESESSTSEYEPADDEIRFVSLKDTTDRQALESERIEDFVLEQMNESHEKAKPSVTHVIKLILKEEFQSSSFFLDGFEIAPSREGLNLYEFNLAHSSVSQELLIVGAKDTCRTVVLLNQSKKITPKCE